ncbi:hypothetical protein PR048_013184 [Dryococelus australis]|uniref:Uncharacterized protein n=1 Tax=Dryococelus australis TaxID=614101 RepID=A0ABQ9HRR7_9NEOP|nr:hypothetical protein PR048_013184 [Dryococelus australis]
MYKLSIVTPATGYGINNEYIALRQKHMKFAPPAKLLGIMDTAKQKKNNIFLEVTSDNILKLMMMYHYIYRARSTQHN